MFEVVTVSLLGGLTNREVSGLLAGEAGIAFERTPLFKVD